MATKNDVSLEIKSIITLANRYYYGLNRQLSSRALSRTIKLILYNMPIQPVLLYGAESWTQGPDAATLRVFEKKVKRNIFGPVWDGYDFRIQQWAVWAPQRRRRCVAYFYRMKEDAPVRRVIDAVIFGSRRRRRAYMVWLTRVEALEAEPPGIMCWGRPKSVNRVVNGRLSE